jgi:hypothetical protein
MAMALEHSKTRFNTKDVELLNHHIYVFCGDGCLEEGVTSGISFFFLIFKRLLHWLDIWVLEV